MLTIWEEKTFPEMEIWEPGAGCWLQAASRTVTTVYAY
jgi:hypothetical protein